MRFDSLSVQSSLQQQIILRDDLATDKIRQSAIGEREVRTALKDDDFALLAKSSRPGCSACTAGNTPNDHEPEGAHGAFSPA